MSEAVVNAIIAGIGSADNATEQTIQIIENLDRAGCGPATASELLRALIDLHGDCTAQDQYMRAAEFVIAKALAAKIQSAPEEPRP